MNGFGHTYLIGPFLKELSIFFELVVCCTPLPSTYLDRLIEEFKPPLAVPDVCVLGWLRNTRLEFGLLAEPSALGVCVRILGADPGRVEDEFWVVSWPGPPMLIPLAPGWAGGCAVIAVRLKLEFRVPRFLTPKSLVFEWKLGEIPLVTWLADEVIR